MAGIIETNDNQAVDGWAQQIEVNQFCPRRSLMRNCPDF